MGTGATEDVPFYPQLMTLGLRPRVRVIKMSFVVSLVFLWILQTVNLDGDTPVTQVAAIDM